MGNYCDSTTENGTSTTTPTATPNPPTTHSNSSSTSSSKSQKLYDFYVCLVMYRNISNRFLNFHLSCNCHNSQPDNRPSQELDLWCRKLHRWDSAGPGAASRHLLPLQILQVQGPQLPHPLKSLHLTYPRQLDPFRESSLISTHSSAWSQTVFSSRLIL